VLPDDDPSERMRMLGRPVNDAMIRMVASEPLVLRIDLDQ
jgi:hypothetical protein